MKADTTETRTVVVEREMPHPPEKIWRALTQSHLIEEWLMKNDFKPDMGRRFNFSAGNIGSFGVVYPGFDRGPLFAGGSLYTGTSKTDPRYWPRRFKLPTTLELNYNLNNVLALNPHATDVNIWSMPVWWDCTTDAEYQGYLQ